MPHTIDIFMICWEGICICWDKFETHLCTGDYTSYSYYARRDDFLSRYDTIVFITCRRRSWHQPITRQRHTISNQNHHAMGIPIQSFIVLSRGYICLEYRRWNCLSSQCLCAVRSYRGTSRDRWSAHFMPMALLSWQLVCGCEAQVTIVYNVQPCNTVHLVL